MAPFRERPDGVEAGRLEGPFSGRVVAQREGQPIADATVYATWTYMRGYGFAQPAAVRTYVGKTDARGEYWIPEVSSVGAPDAPNGAWLHAFDLVIDHPEYIGFRSTAYFSDFARRRSFSQLRNRVALARRSDSASEARLWRYLGRVPQTTHATAARSDRAATDFDRDRDRQAEPTRRVPFLRAAVLALPLEMIREVTDFTGAFDPAPLADDQPEPGYSSWHYRARDRDEGWDVAVRVWRDSTERAVMKYDELRATLGDPPETHELGDATLVTRVQQIIGIAKVDRACKTTFLLTCGTGLCPTETIALRLARRVYQRLCPESQTEEPPR